MAPQVAPWHRRWHRRYGQSCLAPYGAGTVRGGHQYGGTVRGEASAQVGLADLRVVEQRFASSSSTMRPVSIT